jgi:hypothetical protein
MDQVGTGDRLRLRAALAFEFSPDADERKQGTVVIQRKRGPSFRRRIRVWRVFGKAVGRNQAAVFRLELNNTAPAGEAGALVLSCDPGR